MTKTDQNKLTKAESKKVHDEKMLYQAYLDLWYAEDLYKGMVDDFSEELKELRRNLKKATKNLVKAAERYELINGHKPTKPKR